MEGESADSGVRSRTSLSCWCLTERISCQQVVYLVPFVCRGGGDQHLTSANDPARGGPLVRPCRRKDDGTVSRHAPS